MFLIASALRFPVAFHFTLTKDKQSTCLWKESVPE